MMQHFTGLLNICSSGHFSQFVFFHFTTAALRFLSLLKPWSNGLASRRKFPKPELAYGLVKGGQTDLQVGSQVAKTRKFHVYHWLVHFYNNRLLAINLCRLALGGQTVKNLCLLAFKFELDQSQRKSTQVDASRRKWVAKRNAS